MKPGPLIRRAFGPFECQISHAYRRLFVDLHRFAHELALEIDARAILEVGCGEGMSTETLARAFPAASIVGLDITDRAGRLFRGDSSRVRFLRQTIGDFSAGHPQSFDLAIVCDVLHHVPWEEHRDFVQCIAKCLQPGGWLVVKEWEPSKRMVHCFCDWGDRYLGGDPGRYMSKNQIRTLLEQDGGLRITREWRVPPWPNNISLWARVE